MIGMAAEARDRLQLGHQQRHVVRRVLAIDQQPVIARTRADLSRVGIGQRQPQADLRPAFPTRAP